MIQFFVASIALLHSPTRAHIDPWTGIFFGDGGVENELHPLPDSTGDVYHGGVIMSKLANETAKYVFLRPRINVMLNDPEEQS